MHALLLLTVANIKSFTRDRAALFWTLAFPLIFVILFGSIFSGGNSERTIGFADLDDTPASATLEAAFASVSNVKLVDGAEADLLARMRKGEVSAVIVVPAGYAIAVETKTRPANLTVYTDPSQSSADGATRQLVGFVLSQVNQAATGLPPAVAPSFQPVQTSDLTFISYLVPSILGMSLMQLGVFAAIPLVADRQKLILKRSRRRRSGAGSSWAATSHAAAHRDPPDRDHRRCRLGGLPRRDRRVVAADRCPDPPGIAGVHRLGYVIASFASTEDAANGMTSAVQFPLMFLSGTFFPIDSMPDALRTVARALPLTYLGDGLRQVMVDGTPFSPLWVCFLVLRCLARRVLRDRGPVLQVAMSDATA